VTKRKIKKGKCENKVRDDKKMSVLRVINKQSLDNIWKRKRKHSNVKNWSLFKIKRTRT
jgi:hypothetical protein